MTIDPYLWVLPAAFVLDLLLGDPVNMPHPVRLMGRGITFGEEWLRKKPFSESTAGVLLATVFVFGTWLVCVAATETAHAVHPVLAQGVHVVLIYYALSAKSLKVEADKVLSALQGGGLGEAKKQVATIVGRDVAAMDEQGVLRATVETVAENLVDGFLAPLFFATLGGGPLAMAYKMVNTMDSMIGHKNSRYARFGRFAARLDDVLNFVPARLSTMVISFAAVLTKHPPLRTFFTALRDGRKHPSPNAGIPEAAFAGALGIKLGGPNIYGGHLVEKPYIGKETRPVEREDIRKASRLMLISAILWFLVCWTVTAIRVPWWSLPLFLTTPIMGV